MIEVLVQRSMLQWALKLLDRQRGGGDIHIFSLDFASALIANMLHSAITLEALERQPRMAKEALTSLLLMLKEPATVPTSVLMHVLIGLSYMSKERFAGVLEETRFVDRVSDFVEVYS